MRGTHDDVVARKVGQGRHGAAAKAETANGGGGGGVQEEGGRSDDGREGTRLRGFVRPASVLRFVRDAVERVVSKAG